MKEKQDELNVLFPVNFDVIGGEKINLRPFMFGKWPEVIAKSVGLVKSFMQVLNENGEEVLDIDISAEGLSAKTKLFSLVTDLITQGGDDIYNILAISARKDRAWVDELEGEDGIKLLLGTIQVNKDFFIERVVPMLKMQKLKMMQKVDLAGVLSPKD